MGPRRSSKADEQRPSKCNAFSRTSMRSVGCQQLRTSCFRRFCTKNVRVNLPASFRYKKKKYATPNNNLIPGLGKFVGLLFPNSKNGKYFCLHPWDHFFPYPPETKRRASVSTHLRPLPGGRTFLPAHAMTTNRARNQRKERGLVPPGEKAE